MDEAALLDVVQTEDERADVHPRQRPRRAGERARRAELQVLVPAVPPDRVRREQVAEVRARPEREVPETSRRVEVGLEEPRALRTLERVEQPESRRAREASLHDEDATVPLADLEDLWELEGRRRGRQLGEERSLAFHDVGGAALVEHAEHVVPLERVDPRLAAVAEVRPRRDAEGFQHGHEARIVGVGGQGRAGSLVPRGPGRRRRRTAALGLTYVDIDI